MQKNFLSNTKFGTEDSIQSIKVINNRILNAMETDKQNSQTFSKLKKMLLLTCQMISEFLPEQCEFIAVTFYNLAVYGGNEEALRLAISYLQKSKVHHNDLIRWNMQLAVIQSSSCNDHALAYKIISKVQQEIIDILKNIEIEKWEEMPNTVTFVRAVLNICQEQENDQIIWVYNQRNMLQEFFIKATTELKTKYNVNYPFFSKFDFHISDVMALQRCHGLVKLPQELLIRQYIMMLSICNFTKATQKVYQKNFTEKFNHLKALKIALTAFGIQSTYCKFLLEILINHFGKKLTPINEDSFEVDDYSELIRLLPKQPQQISLLNLILANE